MSQEPLRILEKAFISKHGFNCSVYITWLGHRNGYIEISLGNKALINNFDEKIDSLQVHGGITYNNVIEGKIILGFDCDHGWDLPDPEIFRKFGIYKEIFSRRDGQIRTLEFCVQELEDLSQQLYDVHIIP